MWIFDHTGVGVPNCHMVQGSTVHRRKLRKNLYLGDRKRKMTQKEDINRVNSEIGEITKSTSFFENQQKRKILRRKLDSVIKPQGEW